jgi:hypothetical protein
MAWQQSAHGDGEQSAISGRSQATATCHNSTFDDVITEVFSVKNRTIF